jgi:hypothetical protein
VGECVSSVAHRPVYVIASEASIGVKKIRFGRSFAERAEQELDRNRSPMREEHGY